MFMRKTERKSTLFFGPVIADKSWVLTMLVRIMNEFIELFQRFNQAPRTC